MASVDTLLSSLTLNPPRGWKLHSQTALITIYDHNKSGVRLVASKMAGRKTVSMSQYDEKKQVSTPVEPEAAIKIMLEFGLSNMEVMPATSQAAYYMEKRRG